MSTPDSHPPRPSLGASSAYRRSATGDHGAAARGEGPAPGGAGPGTAVAGSVGDTASGGRSPRSGGEPAPASSTALAADTASGAVPPTDPAHPPASAALAADTASGAVPPTDPAHPPAPAGDDGELARSVRSGLRWSFATQVVMRFVVMASGIVLFRLLDPGQFGEYALALAVVNVLLSCNDLGQDMVVINWAGDNPGAQRTAATLAMLSSGALYVGCFFAAPLLAELFNRPQASGVIRLLAVLVLIDGYIAVPRARLYRTIRQRQISITELAGIPVQVGVSVGLVVAGAGVWGPVVGTVASGAVGAVLTLAYSGGPTRFGFDRTLVRPLLGFGLPGAGTTVVEMLLLNVDTFVVANRLGTTALAFYALAFNVSSWPSTIITQAVRKVSQAALTRMNAEADLLRRRAQQAFALLLNVLVPVCLLLGVLARPLVEFLYSAKSLPAAPVLSWLVVLGGIRVALGFLLDVLIGMGRPRATLRAQTLWLLAAVPALVVGATQGGIRGAAIGHVVAALAVAMPVYLWETHRAGLDLRELLPDPRRPLLGLAAGGLVGWYVVSMIDVPLTALAVGGLAVVAVYLPLAVPRRDLAALAGRLRRRPA